MLEIDTIFKCAQCGHCCEGRGGIVLSALDRARLASFLGCGLEDLVNEYAEKSNGKLKIKTGPDGRCVFFREGAGCSVHAAKPAICQAWPFFRGNLEDPVSFDLAREFCPGINKEATFESFRASGIAWLLARGLIAGAGEDGPTALMIGHLLH